MKRPRTGIRSTRKQKAVTMDSEGEPEQEQQPQNDVNIIPVEESDDSACNVFCYAALADKHDGTMYTDDGCIASTHVRWQSVLFSGICI